MQLWASKNIFAKIPANYDLLWLPVHSDFPACQRITVRMPLPSFSYTAAAAAAANLLACVYQLLPTCTMKAFDSSLSVFINLAK